MHVNKLGDALTQVLDKGKVIETILLLLLLLLLTIEVCSNG